MIDILFSMGAILTIASYMLTNMLYLRLLLIFASVPYIVGALIAGYDKAGMKATIYFSIAYIIVNSLQLIILILDKRPVFLPEELKKIYYHLFHTMTPKEFLRLYKLGEIKSIHKDDSLTTQNQSVDNLVAILEGSVSITKDGKILTKLGAGFFVGEMSFLSEELANATTLAETEVKYISWDKSVLNQLESKNLNLYSKLKNAISLNLIKKLNIKSS